MYFVYILYSIKNRRSYVGTTNNLDKRLKQHNNGEVKSTRAWRPWILIYSEQYEILNDARKREWNLKCTPAGGKFKRLIINNFLNDRYRAPRASGFRSTT
jgi:putative endonuclease